MAEYSYDYWLARQRGEKPEIHDGIAQPGFYRTRATPPAGQKHKHQPWLPVAIFEHDGELIATVGEEQADPAKIWLWCCENDVSEDAYRKALEAGEWADVEPAAAPSPTITPNVTSAPPPIGHNAPPDEAEAIMDQVRTVADSLVNYQSIDNDDQAARAQSLRSRLLEIARDADKKREIEKKPHLEASKAVDAKWRDVIAFAKNSADHLAKALSAFFTDKARQKEEEERKAREAEAKAAASGKPAAPSYAAPAPEPTTVKGGYGRAASIKVVKIVTGVTDWDALWGFMKEHPEVRDLLTKLAQRAIDKGHTVPGVTVEEQRKVA